MYHVLCAFVTRNLFIPKCLNFTHLGLAICGSFQERNLHKQQFGAVYPKDGSQKEE
jgi:hypothetical protein